MSEPPEQPKLRRIDSTAIAGQLGPWKLRQTPDGHWEWVVLDRSTLEISEPFRWRIRPLSSVKQRGVRRILLIGESAAGSFGYGLGYSLGAVIEHRLNRGKRKQFELIDLTCVNASWDGECMDAIQHGMTLQPDLVLVYCGNNEPKSLLRFLTEGHITENPYASAARWAFDGDDPKQRIAIINQCLEFHFKNLVHRTVHACRARGIDVAFIIPENNLADWSPVEKVPHHIGGETLMSWWSQIERADASFASGDYQAALAAYRQARKLDGGMCQRSLHGEGGCLLRLGDGDAAYATFVRARDAGLGPFVEATPGITSGVAHAMRETLHALGVPFVDSPALFREAAQSGIPDREIFIDYCHLSPRGHELVGQAAARMIEELFGVKPPGRSRTGDLLQPLQPLQSLQATGREAALGALMAALHNYNLSQGIEIVRYWLAESHRQWKGVTSILAFFADHACTAWRERWTIEHLEDAGPFKGLPFYYRFFFARCFYQARFDPELKAAIEDVLGRPRAQAEASLEEQTRGMLRDLDYRIHSRFFLDRHRGMATLERRGSRHGWERPALEILFVASHGTAILPWDGEGPASLCLDVECLGRPGKLVVGIDGRAVGRPRALRAGFQRVVLPLPRLAAGLHELSIRFFRMRSLADMPDAQARNAFIEDFGYYPVAARLMGSWLRPAAKNVRSGRGRLAGS
ncbi:MAG TPA: tetratricopeptide repeat protein [Kofleriaceae bacterium]|nr:tetratricopeptide repeat protein [Kofleriaceae bacterium]